MRYAHAMPFGAALHPGGGVDFRLWAPGAAQPALIWQDPATGEERRTRADALGDGHWHCHIAQAGAGTRYQWEVDAGLRVPDPASRSNPQGPLAASAVTDPLAFSWDGAWTGRPWHEAVLYELHVGTFTPEGTFAAAIDKLPDLAELGITAVELMPVATYGGRFGWGYDGVLPFAPHAAYGTPDELKAFVQAAHRLGMMVLLDVVYNHFGPEGNYLPHYAPQFFSTTHTSPWGAALNFDGAGSATVREFFIHNALYWLEEFRFDGLRLDAVHAIADASAPDIVEELAARVREAVAGRHVHLVLENERNEHRRLAASPQPGQCDAQWNDDFHHALHVLLTGERHGYYGDYAADPLGLLAQALTHGFLFEASARHPDGRRTECIPAPAQPLAAMVNFIHNHDQIGNRAFGERLSQLAPPDAVEWALLLCLLTPATPMLFQGDEFAAASPFLYFADWHGELREAVRAGRRREFGHQHDARHGLPDPCSAETFSRSQLVWDEASRKAGQTRRELVRAALLARRRWIVPRQSRLATGEHTAQRIGTTGLEVRWRYRDGAELVLDANCGATPQAPMEPPAAPGMHHVFAHRWPPDGGSRAAWSARWRLKEA